MKNFGNWFWGTILGVAVLSIGGGMLGGQLQRVGAMPTRMQVPEIAPVPIQRSLVGARGREGQLDPYEPFVDDAVVERPDGWAPDSSPAEGDSVRMAIVIDGIGADDTLDKRFMQIPYPLTFAVPATGDAPSQTLRTDPHELLVDTDGARSVDQIEKRLHQIRGGGVITPLAGNPPRPGPLVHDLATSGAFLIDGMAGGSPTYFEVARGRVPTASRDIVIDAYDEEGYAAYMLRQAVHLARRTGVAIVVAHATPDTYEALRTNLVRLTSDNDVQIVPVGDLVK
ncbi:MAG TPA: divergent polysaccharide deacetylase family protein [Candidatus Baltobacteraceae bacterium]